MVIASVAGQRLFALLLFGLPLLSYFGYFGYFGYIDCFGSFDSLGSLGDWAAEDCSWARCSGYS